MDETTKKPSFGEWLLGRARHAGYQIPDRGEQARLARDSGIVSPTLTRLLADTGTPSIESLQALAEFFDDPLSEILIHAGWLTHDDIDRVRTRPGVARPITPDEALDDLGITDPGDRRIVEAVIDTVKRNRATGDSPGRTAD
ncbi:helix-turn-helix domain-containing protein [Streptomyces sp. NPDC012693]|uniref:helix-turn-helix domain-containing protein n=1 Tax=Streptomyces sp. NPDC012693 TaxID=3364844 RepID=UPI0036A4EF5A